MEPLKVLNNVQKARLFHALMFNEIPGFISFLYEVTEKTIDEKEQLAATWKNPMFGFDFWLALAGDAKKKLDKYPNELLRSSKVFGDQLFDGYTAIYTIQAVTQYSALESVSGKFKQAVTFLFN